MRILYHFHLCPFSRQVRVFLREKGVDFELIAENFWEKRPKFMAMNPAGKVPVLVENNYPMCDSVAICEYIEETCSDNSGLYGENSHVKAEVRRLVAWFNQKFYDEVTKHVLNERIIRFCEDKGGPNSKFIRAAKNNLLYHIDYMAHLISKRQWLAADCFSVADIVAASHLSVLDYVNDVPWNYSKVVKDWYMLIKSRPSFRPLLEDRVLGFIPYTYYTALDF